MKVFLAGRVAFESDGRAVDEARFPGRQGRLLFAYLAAEHGRLVPRDELAEALWGESPPATWDKALTVLASKLRGVLTEHGIDGAVALTSAFGCYRLELPAGSWVDVRAAADAAQDAERGLAAGAVGAARAAAGEAESLTRQPFLPGESGAWVDGKRRELADVRTRALTALAESSLRSGDAHAAAAWAEQAIALQPFRESGYRWLMEAHAAAGNRAEALRVYERCRGLLAEELGAYPSPETEAIYRRLLEAPPPRRPPRTPPEPPPPSDDVPRRRGKRRLVGGIAVAVLVAAATVAGVLLATGGGSHASVAPNSVVALDSSGAIAATVPVGTRPVAVASAAGSLWVANLDDRSVSRVDAASQRIVRTIPVGGSPTALAATDRGVWVTDDNGEMSEIDPTYDRLTSARRLPATAFPGQGTVWPMLAAFGSIWTVHPDGYVLRSSPSGRRTGSADVGNNPSAIAAGAGSLWVTNRDDGTVTRIDPGTLLTTTIPVGHGPAAVAINAAGAWVANAGDGALVRLDPETNAVAGSTRIGNGPTAVLATPTALWVANGGDGTVMRLDPRSGKVAKTIRLGGTPTALTHADGQVWVTVAPAPPPAPAAGGVARLTMQSEPPSLDPALAGAAEPLQIAYATCANLVTYPDKPAPAGSRIVPEVAEAVPTPTDAGRTYTFTIRRGFRFSPPSNEAVTAGTFKSTIERVANPRMGSPLASQLSGIVGYRDYVTGRASGLRGVAARGRTLTIRLSRPDGSFLANLAGEDACAVPSGTPAVRGGLDDIPSAGPYYIASYTPRQQLVLRRNPNYHGDRPRHLDQFVLSIGVDSSRALDEVEAGAADYALDGLPPDAGPRLESVYGPGSPAAQEGRQQYFISTANGDRLLQMNTSRPLFSSLRLRRAVNDAIDRPALVAEDRKFTEATGFNAGVPTDDLTFPASEGAANFHLYPLHGPDLRRARRIAGKVKAKAIMYTPNSPPWLQEAQIIRRDLRPLGIDVEVREFTINEFFARLGRRGEPFDLAVSGWAGGNTDPDEAVELFDGRTIRASGNIDFSYFDDPAFDRQRDAANKLSGPRRYRAYRRLQLELERDLVPAAAFASDVSRDFFSARIGCQVFQPVYGMDLAALCLR